MGNLLMVVLHNPCENKNKAFILQIILYFTINCINLTVMVLPKRLSKYKEELQILEDKMKLMALLQIKKERQIQKNANKRKNCYWVREIYVVIWGRLQPCFRNEKMIENNSFATYGGVLIVSTIS